MSFVDDGVKSCEVFVGHHVVELATVVCWQLFRVVWVYVSLQVDIVERKLINNFKVRVHDFGVDVRPIEVVFNVHFCNSQEIVCDYDVRATYVQSNEEEYKYPLLLGTKDVDEPQGFYILVDVFVLLSDVLLSHEGPFMLDWKPVY